MDLFLGRKPGRGSGLRCGWFHRRRDARSPGGNLNGLWPCDVGGSGRLSRCCRKRRSPGRAHRARRSWGGGWRGCGGDGRDWRDHGRFGIGCGRTRVARCGRSRHRRYGHGRRLGRRRSLRGRLRLLLRDRVLCFDGRTRRFSRRLLAHGLRRRGRRRRFLRGRALRIKRLLRPARHRLRAHRRLGLELRQRWPDRHRPLGGWLRRPDICLLRWRGRGFGGRRPRGLGRVGGDGFRRFGDRRIRALDRLPWRCRHRLRPRRPGRPVLALRARFGLGPVGITFLHRQRRQRLLG